MVDNSIIGFLFQADKQQRKTLKIYKRQRIIKNATAVMINKTLKLTLNCVLKVLCILFNNNLSQINYAKSNILTSLSRSLICISYYYLHYLSRLEDA